MYTTRNLMVTIYDCYSVTVLLPPMPYDLLVLVYLNDEHQMQLWIEMIIKQNIRAF